MDKISDFLKNLLNNPAFYIAVILLVFIYLVYMPKKEKYGQATITQITAQGPMNTYLSDDSWNYLPNAWYAGGLNKSFCPEVQERYYPKCWYKADGTATRECKHDWLYPYNG